MTDLAARASQEFNPFLQNPHLAMSHYSNGAGINYLFNGSNGQIQYQPVTTAYTAYPVNYSASQGDSASHLYVPNTLGASHPYPGVPTLPSQTRAIPKPTYLDASSPSSHVSIHQQRVANSQDLSRITMDHTECQDSPNAETMLSEPVEPPLEGYPDVHEFDELMQRYVRDLSPKKQDKALIHARRAANIKQVLVDKKTTHVESAQFRFWVKKMFTLQPEEGRSFARKICHEGKPVAVREKLFKILTKAHKQCQHGGRDKTSAQVRKVYSWVPKELISRFVKLCPTCQVRRGTGRNSPPVSEKGADVGADPHFSHTASTAAARHHSVGDRHSAAATSLPLQAAGFNSSTTFQQQNRWMTPLQPPQLENNGQMPASGSMDGHEVYNTIPPMPLNCTNTTPPGVGFASVNPFGANPRLATPSQAYGSASLSHSTHQHMSAAPNYGSKNDHHYH